MDIDLAQLENQFDFIHVGENSAAAHMLAGIGFGQVIDSQHHIFRGADDRLPIGRLE